MAYQGMTYEFIKKIQTLHQELQMFEDKLAVSEQELKTVQEDYEKKEVFDPEELTEVIFFLGQ